MSTRTTNLGFIKPELKDAADITTYNENWDILDAKLHKVTVEDTLLVSNWANGNYTWNNENIVSDSQTIELIPSQSITIEQLEALQQANIVGTHQAVGSVTFRAFWETPTIDIPVVFVIRGDV